MSEILNVFAVYFFCLICDLFKIKKLIYLYKTFKTTFFWCCKCEIYEWNLLKISVLNCAYVSSKFLDGIVDGNLIEAFGFCLKCSGNEEVHIFINSKSYKIVIFNTKAKF